jgi:DNA-binding CsgD family transcriptional regulator
VLNKRPQHGWAALTDTETKIALLVAGGLSNPDIATQMYLSPPPCWCPGGSPDPVR